MSNTHGDLEKRTAHSAQCGPHNQDDAHSAAQRAGRAGAREDRTSAAQSQPESADTPTVTVSDYAAEVGGWVRSTFTPPNVWSQDRAALHKVWAYAARGEWTTETGPARRAGQVYAIAVAVPVIFTAAVIEWAVERPARLIAALVLLALLAQLPPLSWLI